MKAENMKAILIRLPEKLVESIDELVETEQYGSRSEFMRECIRKTMRSGACE